ncbi:SAM-dependent methyltransferase [Actinoplanes sp. NPDC051851]|uniref:SAM-dependent methyltransferase n=1 Tax=Actinoplanes sp. NPDC051851 TaxID=3154753 RepID=UPI0034377FA9
MSDRAVDLDPTVAHPARRYDYWLGGKDNFAADRASGDAIEARFPDVRKAVLANRAVLGRMTRFLAGEAGIRQFLDIGTGLPTADNTHEVAQRVAPESRVLYIDNDPLVMTHARALLTGSAAGRTDYIEADLRDPGSILADPRLRNTLDLGRPVALMLIAVLHFLPDRERERAIVRELVAALPAGSYLAVTHATMDYLDEAGRAAATRMLESGVADTWPSTRDEFRELFDGLELVEPGVVLLPEWRPDGAVAPYDPAAINMWAGLARKP